MGKRIRFNSRDSHFKEPFGCLHVNQSCRLTLEIPVECPAKIVCLNMAKEDGLKLTVPFVFDAEIDGYCQYTCHFSLFSPGLYFYYFVIETPNGAFSLYRYGEGDTNMEDGEKWQLSCLPSDYDAPAPFRGKVMYQIFPDRFAKCGSPDLTGKLMPYTVHQTINEPPQSGPDPDGNWNNDFFGGNLRGITEKLPYLVSLGVGVIYLNPIFMAFSNHRYDTADYLKIDPMLGTDDDLRQLCEKSAALGIAVILDGVFSHVGENSRYFDRNHVFGNGALSNPSSPYRSWFQFSDYPHSYESWWGIRSLPCVNELEPSFLDLIIENKDSVIAHYMKLGVSGFRLDVADELPDEFIARLRRRVKEINPDGIVIGEVWEDASNKISYGIRRTYFTGAEIDGVMNYPFRNAIIALVCGEITTKDFASSVNTIVENYPFDSLCCSMTFLSTHDTPRVRTVIEEKVGEGRAIEVLKAAIVLQYFLPGMPSIYYGDEVGMRGGRDPDNRRFFAEEDHADALLRHLSKLGELRNRNCALRIGTIRISASDERLQITRSHDEQSITLEMSIRRNPDEILYRWF